MSAIEKNSISSTSLFNYKCPNIYPLQTCYLAIMCLGLVEVRVRYGGLTEDNPSTTYWREAVSMHMPPRTCTSLDARAARITARFSAAQAVKRAIETNPGGAVPIVRPQ